MVDTSKPDAAQQRATVLSFLKNSFFHPNADQAGTLNLNIGQIAAASGVDADVVKQILVDFLNQHDFAPGQRDGGDGIGEVIDVLESQKTEILAKANEASKIGGTVELGAPRLEKKSTRAGTGVKNNLGEIFDANTFSRDDWDYLAQMANDYGAIKSTKSNMPKGHTGVVGKQAGKYVDYQEAINGGHLAVLNFNGTGNLCSVCMGFKKDSQYIKAEKKNGGDLDLNAAKFMVAMADRKWGGFIVRSKNISEADAKILKQASIEVARDKLLANIAQLRSVDETQKPALIKEIKEQIAASNDGKLAVKFDTAGLRDGVKAAIAGAAAPEPSDAFKKAIEEFEQTHSAKPSAPNTSQKPAAAAAPTT